MRYRHLLPFLVPGLLGGCAGGAVAPPPPPPPPAGNVAPAVESIRAADVARRIAFLASDELRGRDTPSPGLEAAAEYAAAEFRSFGLRPGGDDGTFIQRFPFDPSALDRAGAVVETRTASDVSRLEHGTDYWVMPARIDSAVGSPIFVGPARAGLLAPEAAAGRPLLFYAPDTASAAWQSAATAAIQAAMAARASAAILIMPPEFAETTMGMLADQLAGQIVPVPMPVVGIRYGAAQQFFREAGVDLDEMRTSSEPMPLPEIVLAIRTPISGTTVEVPNVVAVLPGSDSALSEQYIVFSAHIDHVGVGRPDETGDSIYNGADDDASGTTAVLEIAEAFASLGRRPARSVMFVLVSGEEHGLLGSRYFVESPPVPVEQMAANINMDMIGRNAPDTVVAIGLDYSSLGPALREVAARHPELGLTIAPDLWPEEQLFFRSDHFSFAAEEVPAIFLTTGLHEDYHQPSDEPEKIDNDKVARIARLLFRYAWEMANAAERPQWTEEGLAEVRRVTR